MPRSAANWAWYLACPGHYPLHFADTSPGADHCHPCPWMLQDMHTPSRADRCLLSLCPQARAWGLHGSPGLSSHTLAFLRLHQRFHLQGQQSEGVSPAMSPSPPSDQREKLSWTTRLVSNPILLEVPSNTTASWVIQDCVKWEAGDKEICGEGKSTEYLYKK